MLLWRMGTSAANRSLLAFKRSIIERDWVADVLVFISYFATAKLAQYILFSLHTSPALLWAPTGIALAAVLLKGDKMWVPVFLAYTLALFTLPNYLPFANKLIAIFGFTIQPLIGAWLFRRMGSNGTLHRGRDVMIILFGAACTAAIGPFFNTLGQVMLGALTETTAITFSRAWAGGMLGILVLTPFITGWYHSPSWPMRRSQRGEGVAAIGFLVLIDYILFWTNLPASQVFLFILFHCVALFWIAFRFGSRVNTSAMLFTTVFGIAGSIFVDPSHTPLNTQLFADEMYLILIVPIFFQFFVLMEERRKAESLLAGKVRELEEITHRLSENDTAKNEFIAILAHELRNPLSTVVTTLELLKLEPLEGESTSLISRAEQQTFAMRRLLDDLLDVARMAQKKFDIVRERISLSTLVQHSVDATETAVRDRRHSIEVSLPDKDVELFVDQVRIEQVLINLITNAAKYTDEGGKISVLCRLDDSMLTIDVKDTGHGIPSDRLEQIFSPFQQLNPAPHRSHGIGIGLFLTRQIVELHGGTITALSDGAGKGSIFRVRLPLSNIAPDRVVQPSIPRKTVSRSRKKVLIVDDNEAAAIGMRKLLAHQGHDAREVHTGQAAVSNITAFAPDVVLLDIGLPDISGHDVAAKIREQHGPESPYLIALTGYGQDEDVEKAIKSGFDMHMTKPVSITEIVQVLGTLS